MTATDELRAIRDRLDRFETRTDSKLDRVLEGQARLAEHCEALDSDMSRIKHTVYGNGDGGQVRDIERLKTISGIRSKGFWKAVTFVSAIVSGLVVAGAGAALAFWKG